MEPKLVREHLHTELTRLPIRRPPLQEHPSGGSENAAEGPWPHLSPIVSLSSLHERVGDAGKHNMQAEDHTRRMLHSPFVKESYVCLPVLRVPTITWWSAGQLTGTKCHHFMRALRFHQLELAQKSFADVHFFRQNHLLLAVDVLTAYVSRH